MLGGDLQRVLATRAIAATVRFVGICERLASDKEAGTERWGVAVAMLISGLSRLASVDQMAQHILEQSTMCEVVHFLRGEQ